VPAHFAAARALLAELTLEEQAIFAASRGGC
jgi:hypothetical protein